MYTFEQVIKNLEARDVDHFEQGEDGCRGLVTYRMTNYRFQFSFGLGWEHVSVSAFRETPSWDAMCFFKDIFWPDAEACVQYHPAKEDYVDFHRNCLHIWRPVDGVFPKPPTFMIGPL